MAYINFADTNMEQTLISAGIGDSNGITYEQAAAYTGTLEGELFEDTPEIYTSFDEFQYFTKITEVEVCNFAYFSNLTTITLPESITSIGTQAFAYCYKLEHANIPSGVTFISGGMFEFCNSLRSMDIPENVTTIWNYAFRGCSSLPSITIPSGVTTIGRQAFGNCTSFTSITIEATTPPSIYSDTFSATNNCPIYVPSESVNTYKTATNWSTYADRITSSGSTVTSDIISTDISSYTGTADRVYVLDVEKWYMRTVGGNYREYGIYGTSYSEDPYVGELVIVDSIEYEYSGDTWNSLGAVGDTRPKDYETIVAPTPTGTTYVTADDEYIKSSGNYYRKDYMWNVYEGGASAITDTYRQGSQITPTYETLSDEYIKSGDNYYCKDKVYVTPVSTTIDTGDYVQGSQITPTYETLSDEYIKTDGNYYRKDKVYVTPVSTTIDTGDYVQGSQITPTYETLSDEYITSGDNYYCKDKVYVTPVSTTIDTGDYVQGDQLTPTYETAADEYITSGDSYYCKDYEYVTPVSTALSTGKYVQGAQLTPTYVTADDEYIKSGDNYYCKDYEYVTPVSTPLATGNYIQGDQLTPTYVQGSEEDYIVYENRKYYKNYIYVTPVSTPINTGDYVRGDVIDTYIEFEDIICRSLLINVGGIGDSNGITYGQASAYTGTFEGVFTGSNGKYVKAFNELQYFTSVTTLAPSCFAATQISKITLPPNLVNIGVGAFSNFRAATVTIPDSVKTIGHNAFYSAQTININLPSSLETIGCGAFWLCKNLKPMTMPSNVKRIDSGAFRNSPSALTSNLILPEGLTYVGDDAFYGVLTVSAMTVPSTLNGEYVQDDACLQDTQAIDLFQGMDNLSALTSNSTYIGYGWYRNLSKLENVTLNNTQVIGGYAFSGTKISGITIPDTCTTINGRAFKDCTSLTSLTIPDSVTSIGEADINVYNGNSYSNQSYIVSGCTSLREITVGSGLTSAPYSFMFAGTSSVLSVSYNSRTVGDRWFYNYTNLTSLNIGSNVRTIAYAGFAQATSLPIIDIPDTVTSLGRFAFEDASSAEKIVLSRGLTSIPDYAFIRTSSVTSTIYIPSGITSIGSYAFDSCSVSTFVMESATPPVLGTIGSLWGVDVYVPAGCGDTYRNATGWSRFNIHELGVTLTPSSSAFTEPTGITVSMGNNMPQDIIEDEKYGPDISGITYIYSDSLGTSGETDYSAPLSVSLDYYNTPIEIDASWTFAGEESTSTAVYSITAVPPVFSPSGGTYVDNLEVSITCQNTDMDIYYTIDGTDPTTGSTLYTQPLILTEDTTIKAISNKGNVQSEVVSETYNMIYNRVTITPSGGTYNDRVNVNIIDREGYPIYYTLDGTDPTTASTSYGHPIVLNTAGTYTLKAVSYGDGEYSYMKTETYTIVDTKALTPVITPDEGEYVDNVTVDIYPNEEGDIIFYTIDGTEPTDASYMYSDPLEFVLPFNLTGVSYTVKAKAYNTNHNIPWSDTAVSAFDIVEAQKSHKSRRASDNYNGIYIKDVDYSGISTETRSITLPSAITVTDTEADITWGYQVDGSDENLGQYGTRCKVEDTSITIHVEFTHGGKDYTLEKEIPCTCIVQDGEVKAYTIEIDNAYAIVTLDNQLMVKVRARVRHTGEDTVNLLSDLNNFTLSGSSTNGDFICDKEGAYFVYDGILTANYSGSSEPANDITLTLFDNRHQEADRYTIPVTFDAGSIFEVRDDAIRMAVLSAITYTDGEVSGITNRMSQLEINISGITGTVSAVTKTVSGITADISQIKQTESSITTTVYALSGTVDNMSGTMVTHSEIAQVASAITMNVYNELGENTGINISAGTITLNAETTIIDGQLNMKDGLIFTDASGNPVTELDSDEIGPYSAYSKTHIYGNNTGVTYTNQTTYNKTLPKIPLGTFTSGDVFTLNEIQEFISFKIMDAEYFYAVSGGTMSIQANFYVEGETTPFSNTSYNATYGDRGWSVTGSPISTLTVPSGVENKTVYVAFTNTSSQSPSGIGELYIRAYVKIAADAITSNHIGKSGIVIDHAVNNVTYIGTDTVAVKKNDSGVGFMQHNASYTQMTLGGANYYLTSGTFPEHPDNMVSTTSGRHLWVPKSNFTELTNVGNLEINYGTITGFEGLGEWAYAKIWPETVRGTIVLDSVLYASETRVPVLLLPPAFSEATTEDNVGCHRQIREGYTVKILNMGVHSHLVPNVADRRLVTTDAVLMVNGEAKDYYTITSGTQYVEAVYMGVRDNTPTWFITH